MYFYLTFLTDTIRTKLAGIDDTHYMAVFAVNTNNITWPDLFLTACGASPAWSTVHGGWR